MKFTAFCAALCILAAPNAPARAAGPFYLGTWKLTGAVAAPWAGSPQKHGREEPARLLGKTIVFNAKEIAGPQPFECKGPHYKLSDFSAGMLFQGAFEEMQAKDKTADPNKIAASLGFTGESIKTLETGCEFDFHFVDAATAEIGLNDYVYTLSKQ